MSGRDEVLRAVVELGQAPTAVEVARQVGTTDLHSVVHHLFTLRRDGLIRFKERPRGQATAHGRAVGKGVNGGKVPTDIEPLVRAVTAYLLGKG